MPFRETRTVQTPFKVLWVHPPSSPPNLRVKVEGAGGNNLFWPLPPTHSLKIFNSA